MSAGAWPENGMLLGGLYCHGFPPWRGPELFHRLVKSDAFGVQVRGGLLHVGMSEHPPGGVMLEQLALCVPIGISSLRADCKEAHRSIG